MADFVFDESCYIRGLYAQVTDRDDDRLASRLLQLLQVRHRWIITRAIRVAYFHQIKKHVKDRNVNALALIRSFRDIDLDTDRSHSPIGLRPVPGTYDHRDDHMVEAAAAVPGSLLITLDNKLIKDLTRDGIPSRCGFTVLDVSAAWRLLGPRPDSAGTAAS
jgi:hypothetical protein